MNWPEIEAIIYSEEDDPHRLLGPQCDGGAGILSGRCFDGTEAARSKDRGNGAGGRGWLLCRTGWR